MVRPCKTASRQINENLLRRMAGPYIGSSSTVVLCRHRQQLIPDSFCARRMLLRQSRATAQKPTSGVGCRHPQTSSKPVEGCRSRGRWDQSNTRHRCLLDARPAVKEGGVLATCPQQCKVGV